MHLYSKGAATARRGSRGPLGSPGKQQMGKTWEGDGDSILETGAGCGAHVRLAGL